MVMETQKACELYLAYAQYTKNLSGLTIKSYRQDLNHFLTINKPDTPINNYDRETIHQFVNSMFAKGQAPSSVKRRLACLKSFFKWLRNSEYIKKNPFENLELVIKLPVRLPRDLGKGDLKKLLDTACNEAGIRQGEIQCISQITNKIDKKTINALTLLISIELLLTTGIRISELTGIRLNDIHIEECYIHIRGKGQRERRVFITDKDLQKLIMQYTQVRKITEPQHSQLLVNSQGRPASSQIIRLWMAKLSKKANLKRKATPHMYRHSTATQLLEAGVDVRYVQKLLGHQSITTTQIYTHVNNDQLFQALNKANLREKIIDNY